METPARVSWRRQEDGTLVVVLAGRWRLEDTCPADPGRALEDRPVSGVAFDCRELEAWDSGLLAFVARVDGQARRRGLRVDRAGLPVGLRRLLALAEGRPAAAVPRPAPRPPLLARLGLGARRVAERQVEVLAFVGETSVALARLATGRAHVRLRDLLLQIQQVGVQALPIVGLVSFLAGVILAFVSAAQLEMLGAVIYIADLVGIAVVRDMGAVMAAIVLSGRTGAAFAAELGSMRMRQEIDALVTLGIPPTEFLVLPRLLALTLMMPLLCLYADLLGVLGGAVVGILLLDIGAPLYLEETARAVTMTHLAGGLAKAFVFGLLVASAGCLEGLRSERTAAGVGRATTAAVVDGIVLVVVAWGVFSVVFYLLDL